MPGFFFLFFFFFFSSVYYNCLLFQCQTALMPNNGLAHLLPRSIGSSSIEQVEQVGRPKQRAKVLTSPIIREAIK